MNKLTKKQLELLAAVAAGKSIETKVRMIDSFTNWTKVEGKDAVLAIIWHEHVRLVK